MVESITQNNNTETHQNSCSIESKLAAYYTNQLSHNRTIYSYERSNIIKEGDVVIFYERHDHQKKMIITKGQTYTS